MAIPQALALLRGVGHKPASSAPHAPALALAQRRDALPGASEVTITVTFEGAAARSRAEAARWQEERRRHMTQKLRRGYCTCKYGILHIPATQHPVPASYTQCGFGDLRMYLAHFFRQHGLIAAHASAFAQEDFWPAHTH